MRAAGVMPQVSFVGEVGCPELPELGEEAPRLAALVREPVQLQLRERARAEQLQLGPRAARGQVGIREPGHRGAHLCDQPAHLPVLELEAGFGLHVEARLHRRELPLLALGRGHRSTAGGGASWTPTSVAAFIEFTPLRCCLDPRPDGDAIVDAPDPANLPCLERPCGGPAIQP